MSALIAEKALTRASREWLSRPVDERYLSMTSTRPRTSGRTRAGCARTRPVPSSCAGARSPAAGSPSSSSDLGELDATYWSLG